jgi:hypothetical protein
MTWPLLTKLTKRMDNQLGDFIRGNGFNFFHLWEYAISHHSIHIVLYSCMFYIWSFCAYVACL